MFVGAVFLSHSPLITGIKSEGQGDEYEEMLSRQLKHPHGRLLHEPEPEPEPTHEAYQDGLPPFSSA
jgi:hypothetical protein